jgi:glycerol transport system ATP-binding protein
VFVLGAAGWPADGPAASLPDGRYTLGLRPHLVTPRRTDAAQVPLRGVVQLTELSGSESVAHFAVGDRTWVAQSNGVHPYRVGEPHDFFLDVRQGLYFAEDGRRAA